MNVCFYRPNATARLKTVRFVVTIVTRISNKRHIIGGICIDGYASVRSCRKMVGMQRRLILFWIESSRRTPLPLALLAIYKGGK